MRLSLFAGAGGLVPAAVAAAREGGHKLQVLSLTPRDDLDGVKVVKADAGNPVGILFALKTFRTTHIVMAGAIELSDQAREGLARFVNGKAETEAAPARTGGDTSLSHLATALEKLTGAKVIGVQDLAPGLLAPAGRIAGPEIGLDELAEVDRALRAAREIGRLDLGQAIVAAGHRIVAAEDVAGTDALLERVARYRADGLAGDGDATLVLAKAMKPGQPAYVDLPAIGPDTVTNAANAGVRIIAVEAGRTLIIDRERLVAIADESKVSVVGRALGDD
jgi:UDP-2,3-diacylglucosamine hydrolase